jgi:hypothetical protein
LRSKDQGAQNQQIQCALQQLEAVGVALGRHLT